VGNNGVRCLVQPGDGVAFCVDAINGARKTLEIAIFRFNRREVEKALEAAVARGVHVRALIASVNRGGETNLRQLEMRLLAAGVTVARTATDLIRYHNKMMIVDGRELHLLAFNLTWLDMERSRSFGVITTNRTLVREAAKLFDADCQRVPYTPASSAFLVSPLNARAHLSTLIRGAKKELLIYDPEISDPAMMRLLAARAKAGIEIRVLGKIAKNSAGIVARKTPMRLHTRTIIRDGRHVFVGSQSLRTLELDARREAGAIFTDAALIGRLTKTFNADWEAAATGVGAADAAAEPPRNSDDSSPAKVAKKVAKAVANDLPPIGPFVESSVRELAGRRPELNLNTPDVEATVKSAVKDAVKEVVKNFMEEAVQQMQSGAK